jgi:hypothetical protein
VGEVGRGRNLKYLLNLVCGLISCCLLSVRYRKWEEYGSYLFVLRSIFPPKSLLKPFVVPGLLLACYAMVSR